VDIRRYITEKMTIRNGTLALGSFGQIG